MGEGGEKVVFNFYDEGKLEKTIDMLSLATNVAHVKLAEQIIKLIPSQSFQNNGLTWRLFQRNSKKDRITELSFSRLFTDLIKRMDCHEIVANEENMLIFKFSSQDELKRLLNDVDIKELKKIWEIVEDFEGIDGENMLSLSSRKHEYGFYSLKENKKFNKKTLSKYGEVKIVGSKAYFPNKLTMVKALRDPELKSTVTIMLNNFPGLSGDKLVKRYLSIEGPNATIEKKEANKKAGCLQDIKLENIENEGINKDKDE